MRRKNPEQERPFRTPWVPIVPIAGITANLALMYSLGSSNWLRLFVWLAIGQVIYFVYGRRNSRLSRTLKEPDEADWMQERPDTVRRRRSSI